MEGEVDNNCNTALLTQHKAFNEADEEAARTARVVQDRPVYTAKDLKQSMGIESLNHPKTCKQNCANFCESIAHKWECSQQCLLGTICRKLPFIEQVKNYKLKKFLVADIFAGLTVGIMHIPQGLGFALLAGLPPVYGLYTSFFPVIVYFFFTSSRSTSFGTQSLVCLMLGPVLERECQSVGLCSVHEEHSFSDTSMDLNFYNTSFPGLENVTQESLTTGYVTANQAINLTDVRNESSGIIYSEGMQFKLGLAILLGFLIGAIQMLLSVFQMGVISVYFSETFISACNAGAAFQIVTTQVKFIFGLALPPVSGRFKLIKTWIAVFRNIKDINIADFVISVITLLVLILVKKLINENPKIKPKLKMPIPIEIIVVILTTAITKFAKLDSRFQVNVVGVIPQGIPAPSLPAVHQVKAQYIVDAVPIALIGFLSAVLMAKLFANKYDYRVDINQELFANGIANMCSSFFACFPSSVAPPRTMLFDSVGGKTQIAFIFSSVLVLLVLLVIGQLFQTLPTAVLACIIVVALIPLFERLVDGKYLWKVNKLDFLVWIGTVTSVIIVDLGVGIVIGVLLSIISVVLHTQKPKSHLARSLHGSNIYVNAEALDHIQTTKPVPASSSLTPTLNNVIVFKFESPLYYANSDIFNDRVLHLLQSNKFSLPSDSLLPDNTNIGNDLENESMSVKSKQIDSNIDVKLSDSRDNHPKSSHGRVLVLDFSCVHYMDVVGLKTLKILHKKVKAQGLDVLMACCNLEILKTMERFGLLEVIGEDHIYFSVHDAVVASVH